MNSPCNKICVMDPASGLCEGCFRTLDEIARWGGMTDAEQVEVFSLIEKRKSDVPEVPVPPFA